MQTRYFWTTLPKNKQVIAKADTHERVTHLHLREHHLLLTDAVEDINRTQEAVTIHQS